MSGPGSSGTILGVTSLVFALKLMDLYSSCQEMFNDANLVVALANWGYKTKLTGMHVERMLAAIKASTPLKAPHAERLLSAGYLGQWLQRHWHDFGGNDPRVVTQEQLLDAGVPLVAKRKIDNQFKASGSRGHMCYAGEQRSLLAQQGHKISNQDKGALMQQWSDEFKIADGRTRTKFQPRPGRRSASTLRSSRRTARRRRTRLVCSSTWV